MVTLSGSSWVKCGQSSPATWIHPPALTTYTVTYSMSIDDAANDGYVTHESPMTLPHAVPPPPPSGIRHQSQRQKRRRARRSRK